MKTVINHVMSRTMTTPHQYYFGSKEKEKIPEWVTAQIDIIDAAVIRLMNDYDVEEKMIAKIVMASMANARQDKIDNKCAYCSCSFPCSSARSSDPREGRSGARR